MRPAVQKIVDELIDDMPAGPTPADLVEAFALPVPSLVILDGIAVLLDPAPAAEPAADVRHAAAVCPALAVHIEE